MKDLKGKVAVITGATSGIGAAVARLLSKDGAEVILLGRNQDRGSQIEKELQLAGGKAQFLSCDVANKNTIRKIQALILTEYPTVDILFNNAGVFVTSPLEEITDEDWERSFDTNVSGMMHMTKGFIGALRSSCGVIINNASISGLEGYTSGTKQYIYATTKAAVIKFSKLCALNYAKDIRVNCICPGVIDTDLFTNRDFSRFDNTIPMGRVGHADEVARLVRFLVSEDAAYITGAVIPIDGGASLT